jgi:hypothetical protein
MYYQRLLEGIGVGVAQGGDLTFLTGTASITTIMRRGRIGDLSLWFGAVMEGPLGLKLEGLLCYNTTKRR